MFVFRSTPERKLKLKAVKMLKKGDETAKQIAKELGVKYGTLLNWKKAYELKGIKAFPKEKKWIGKESRYLNKSDLINRGWTGKAIDKFLGRVSKKVENPHGKKFAPTCLYSRERVEKAEKDPEFIKWFEKKVSKKDQYKKMVETKTTKTLDIIKNLKIEVLRDNKYLQNAIDHYNKRPRYRRHEGLDFYYNVKEVSPATVNSDPAFLERISVNYIRHQKSGYESAIRILFGGVGKRKAYMEVVRKTFQEIIKVYPELKEECENQMNRKLEYLQDIEDGNIEKYFHFELGYRSDDDYEDYFPEDKDKEK